VLESGPKVKPEVDAFLDISREAGNVLDERETYLEKCKASLEVRCKAVLPGWFHIKRCENVFDSGSAGREPRAGEGDEAPRAQQS